MNELLNSKRMIIYVSISWVAIFIFLSSFKPFYFLSKILYAPLLNIPSAIIGIIATSAWIVLFFYFLSKLTLYILKKIFQSRNN